MARKYVRKTEKAKWSSDDLKNAKQAVAGELLKREAANICKIPFSTLKLRFKNDTDSNPSLGRTCDFPPKVLYGMADIKLR